MNSRTRALEYSRMQECCDADLGARDFWFFLSSWVLECSSSCLLKLFSPKSSRIRRRFAMARLFPALRTRRSSKSGGGFSAQPRNSAATACIAHKSLRICERCRLITTLSRTPSSSSPELEGLVPLHRKGEPSDMHQRQFSFVAPLSGWLAASGHHH